MSDVAGLKGPKQCGLQSTFAFGSFCKVHPTHLIELALGLRLFICLDIKAHGAEELENWFVEGKFEERIKGRGLIFRGWAPQVLILSHQTIGAFITHCGWNSVLEGVSAGVPFITWPMYEQQFFNEKLIVEVVKTVVRVGVDAPSHWGEEVLVKREDVKKAIEVLMGEGDGVKEIRERAKERCNVWYKCKQAS